MPVLSTIGAMAARGFGWLFKAAAAATEGKLYAFGANSTGQLGLGDTTNRSSPVQVGALTNWKSFDAMGTSWISIKSDGTIWGCGNNDTGQLAQGNITARSSPVQIGALTTWAQNGCGAGHCIAIKTDGTAWAWGNGADGRLGTGNTTSRSSPVQIGALTDWSFTACGGSVSSAIKTGGTLWTWGYNQTFGALGLGDTTDRSSPTQVGALTNWSRTSVGNLHTIALKTDGTIWTWGQNDEGQLGLNDVTRRSSPVQVGALTTWSKIAATLNSCFAIKTDGTLWAWGYNVAGGLGLGDTIIRSSPVQVGALANWALVAYGNGEFTLAIKTDGTLWAWGANGLGPLGLGDTTSRSSPVQVGTLTNWLAVTGGTAFSLAIAS